MKTFHKIFLFTLLIVCLSAACLGSHTSAKSHKLSSKAHSKSVLGNIKNIVRNNLSNKDNKNNLGNKDNKNHLGNHVWRNNLGNNDNKNNFNNNNSHSNSKVSKKSLSISKQQSLKQNIKFSYLSTKKISFDANNSFSKNVNVSKSRFSKK
jgi:hypothetical protein